MRTAFAFGALTAVALVAPAGCFFPEFTFNGDGGGGSTSTTTDGGGGSGGTTASTTATTGGTGGMTTSMMTGGGGAGGTGGMTGGGGSGGMMTGGGGAGGSTMTTTTTDTMTTTTTTSTMPPVENCVNGVDDDGDVNIDCKDTECADHSCVSSIPNGWTGYFMLYEGTAVNDPGCTEDFPMEAYVGNFNLNAPPAECAACGCSAPQGEVCTPPGVINVFDAQCGGSPFFGYMLPMPAGWSGACQHPVVNGQSVHLPSLTDCGADMLQPCALSVTSPAPTVNGGFCTSSGGQATVTPATWGGFARACGGPVVTGKGCNINQTCLPTPAAPYVGGLCIRKAGSVNCPAGMFNTKHLYFDDYTDSRMCSGCSCGADTGATCAGDVTMHSDTIINTCSSPQATFPAGGCANLMNNPVMGSAKFTVTTPPTGGSCAPSGGVASGVAVGTFPQTFCCIGN